MKKAIFFTMALMSLAAGIANAQCGDSCVAAALLTVDTTGTCTLYPCSNIGATPSGVPTFPCSAVNNNDVWFTYFVPAGHSSVAVRVQGNGLDFPIVYVYRGSCAALSAL